ncbi:MAG: hypothetical protein N2Z72_07560 [Bacteroidales bacterium]|nr:hypothetical protein [Bacteroidales bacterium]
MKPHDFIVLILDDIHPDLQRGLELAGFRVEFFEDSSQLKNSHGWVVRSKYQITRQWIEQASHLQFIARAGSGLENIDVSYAQERGISVLNSPEGNRDAVGEHALGMLLSLLNNLFRCNLQVKNRIWLRKENWGHELKGKTIGIIGYGNTGSSFAKKLSSLECNILAYDKYKQNFGNSYVKECSMEDIFLYSDIVSLHVPLTDETTYMANKKFFSCFKKPIWFINTSRGLVCNTQDLVDALKAGKVLGAALDVLEWEDISFEKFSLQNLPKTFQELIQMDNVILSPHVAGWTFEAYRRHSLVLLQKILHWFNNKFQSQIDASKIIENL